MGILAVNVAACGSAAGYLASIGKIPASLADVQTGGMDVKVAAVIAGASGLLLGAVGIETLLYRGDQFKQKGPVSQTLELIEKSYTRSDSNIVVKDWINEYNDLHKADDPEKRNSKYAKLVNSYYELATQFYEWGWGSSFHFAYRKMGEGFGEQIRRHEYYLATFLGGLAPGSKILDVGCGIGGPYRNIARFTGWDITGITINEGQVRRGNELAAQQGLAGQCRSVQGDFLALPFEANSFDGVYAIEATCHAPDRKKVYSQIMKVLKPGAMFACYEWCLTDKYQPNNPEHRLMKKKVEEGDGLPDIAYTWDVDDALKAVGFEIVHARDMSRDPGQTMSWYLPMVPGWNPFSQRFQLTWLGKFVMNGLLSFLEGIWLLPQGTADIHRMLQQAAIGLAAGGQSGAFTPMYLLVCRKPLK
mmetsp:Transcript_49616/g.117012  ORF Transcript_49616/g.117012 Transcript_49616/m.117012 type:complete len:417 (+) Transcript_49616:36-1286(+)